MKIKKEFILVFAILIITTGQSVDIYLPSMPDMVKGLQTTDAMIQLSITIALIGYGIGAPVYGPLSDYFGRRFVALTGIGFFTLGSIVCMLSVNIYMLLAGRIFQGIGYASSSGVAAPAVSDVFSGESLVKAYSHVGMALVITPIVAPILGGYLHHYFSWHAPFVLLFLYGITLFALFFRYFPETKHSLKQESIHPAEIARNYISMITNLKYVGFVSCCIFIFSGEIYYLITAPFLLQTKLNITPVQNGWLILVTVGGYLTGTMISKKACKKFSIGQLMTTGCVVSITGAVIMLTCALFAKMTVLTIVAPMSCFMLGAGIIFPNAIAGAMLCFSKKAGSASSLSGMLQVGVAGITTTLAVHFGSVDIFQLAIALLIFSILAIIAKKLCQES